jgi:hypothetical protein
MKLLSVNFNQNMFVSSSTDIVMALQIDINYTQGVPHISLCVRNASDGNWHYNGIIIIRIQIFHYPVDSSMGPMSDVGQWSTFLNSGFSTIILKHCCITGFLPWPLKIMKHDRSQLCETEECKVAGEYNLFCVFRWLLNLFKCYNMKSALLFLGSGTF